MSPFSMVAKGGQIVCANCTVRVLPDLDQCPFEWLGQEPEERKYWRSGHVARILPVSPGPLCVFDTEDAALAQRARNCATRYISVTDAPYEVSRQEATESAIALGCSGVLVLDVTGQVAEWWTV